MRNVILFLVINLSIVSCNESSNKETPSGDYQTIKGEFIFLSDAAVLKGDTFIYGVKLDDKMHELAAAIKPLQRDEYDMVPVIIKGIVNPKTAGTEGWDEIVTIKEILEVKAPRGLAPIKIEAGDKLKTEGGSLKVESEK